MMRPGVFADIKPICALAVCRLSRVRAARAFSVPIESERRLYFVI
jgi:hypothetical protein